MTSWERYCSNCHHTYPLKQCHGTPKPHTTKFQCSECGHIGLVRRKVMPLRFWPWQLALIKLKAEGKNYKEIARIRHMKYDRVYDKFRRLRERVGAIDNCHLIAMAITRGWITTEGLD